MVSKKGEQPDDAEVQKLREKFNQIVNSPETPQQEPKPVENTQEEFKYVDPQKAEDNERITNLIMQQIKELIEIDNNLNSKVKELESKIGNNASTVSATKNIVEQFNSRLEMIEKNMEKFMGLYEVVTNRFNPFVSEEDSSDSGDAIIQDVIKPSNPEIKKIEAEAEEIIAVSGVDSKIEQGQHNIIKEEMEKGIGLMGSETADKMKKELSEHLAKSIGAEMKKALAQHMKLSNEDLKNALKDMMLETITHLKGESKPDMSNTPHDEVHPDYHFYLQDGTPIKNVVGLKNALKSMDDATFTSHVNEAKNDFAEWIRMVYKREDIAGEINNHRDREGILKVLERVS